MRTIPIATAALALLSVTAAAQMTPAPRTPAPSATQAPATVRAEPAINPLTKEAVSEIEGTAVYGSDNDKLGHVSDVLMDPQTKQIERLVVSSGGFLGMGSHQVAIPVDQFAWDGDKGAFKLSTTLAQLKSMPEWVEGETTATGSSTPPRPLPSSSAGDAEK